MIEAPPFDMPDVAAARSATPTVATLDRNMRLEINAVVGEQIPFLPRGVFSVRVPLGYGNTPQPAHVLIDVLRSLSPESRQRLAAEIVRGL